MSNVKCQIQMSRTCEISTMLNYYQSVQIRLAHRLYTDFQYFYAEGMEDSISVHIINASTPDITILPTSFNRINQVLSTPQSSALSLYLNLYMQPVPWGFFIASVPLTLMTMVTVLIHIHISAFIYPTPRIALSVGSSLIFTYFYTHTHLILCSAGMVLFIFSQRQNGDGFTKNNVFFRKKRMFCNKLKFTNNFR